MRETHKVKTLFWISFACEAVVSATFLWMPFVGAAKAGQIMTGITFWLFLIWGYVCIGLANHFRKEYDLKTQKRQLPAKQKIGALAFFSNVPASIFDVMLAAALLFAVITAFTKLTETYLPYSLLSAILLSVHAHCMFNGKIYKFTNLNP